MESTIKKTADPEQVEVINGIWELLELLEKDTSAASLKALTYRDDELLSAYELRKVRGKLKEEWQAKRPKKHHNDDGNCEECLC